MPSVLPVLPIRDAVVFPLTIAPVFVERDRCRQLIEDVTKGDRLVAIVAQREAEGRPSAPEDLYAFGTASVLHDVIEGPDGVVRAAVQGLERVRIVGWARTEPYLVARVQWMPEIVEPGHDLDALVRAARHCYLRFVTLVTELSKDLPAAVDRVRDPRQLVYLLASTTPMVHQARQYILEHPSIKAKLRRLIEHLQQDIAVREAMRKIAADAPCEPMPPEEVPARRRDGPMRELAPEREAGDGRGLRAQMSALALSDDARKEVDRELDRLDRTPPASPEHGMIRTYLDWIVKLPWGRVTGGPIDIVRARQRLDQDHHHLHKVKDRVVEDLAVRRLRAERGVVAEEEGATREPILCFVGPPGVGKTSLGQSIARALGRNFARVALGGIHDEAEIRGHRRTYIGAMPGRIIQALARCGSSDPVFMLDEIDKLGVGYHGDPSAALLEVLDPAQNQAFVDNYLGVPFDLSRVLFVCTANTVDTIPAALLDRMEVLTLSGYTDTEKLFIARRHLLPKAIASHGLKPGEVEVDDDTIRRIVRGYTREAGVRNLSREIASVLRKVVRRVGQGTLPPIRVAPDDIRSYLGSPVFQDEVPEHVDRPGVVTGLAWMPSGGDILFVEATISPGDEDRLVLTGMLGDVMRESAQAALSYLRSNGVRFGIDARAFHRKAVHIHVPAGGIPKDGPSAGVTILVALASLARGCPVRCDLAMTGELTLRGRVLPVGGVKEKVLAAHRAGMRTVILPARCEAQLEDVPEDVLRALQLVFVESADEVLAIALDASVAPVTEGGRPAPPAREPAASVQ
ncbi:MAG TPA: endopeptidase La [Polyangiaceae bacterium]|nr:endopeptidase La [Polyangiaceae bacterium]